MAKHFFDKVFTLEPPTFSEKSSILQRKWYSQSSQHFMITNVTLQTKLVVAQSEEETE